MEQWQDEGIVLSARRHGETGAIVTLLSAHHGRSVGYVRGAQGTKMRGVLEIGNIVEAAWQTRVEGNMGTFTLELTRPISVTFMSDPLRLAALQSICALSDAALPEGEAHHGLYHGTLATLQAMQESEIWAQAYIMWEIAYLRELGFSLDLSKCASTHGQDDLIYVSPKTGRAVSAQAGQPYKDRLLPLPAFLTPQGGIAQSQDIEQALKMTGYFLEHWAFTHHSAGVPEARLRFAQRFANSI